MRVAVTAFLPFSVGLVYGQGSTDFWQPGGPNDCELLQVYSIPAHIKHDGADICSPWALPYDEYLGKSWISSS